MGQGCTSKRDYLCKFKEHNPALKVDLQLWPIECVIAGASGTHSVCRIHQSVKLMMVGSRSEHLTGGEIKHYRHCLARMLKNVPIAPTATTIS